MLLTPHAECYLEYANKHEGVKSKYCGVFACTTDAHAISAKYHWNTWGYKEFKTGDFSIEACERKNEHAERPLTTLANGWLAYGGEYGSPTYALNNGVCTVAGLIKPGNWKPWGHVATLPSDCRPATRLVFTLNAHATAMRVDVDTDGKVTWMEGKTS